VTEEQRGITDIELERVSNERWQDLFAMSTETAADPLWEKWNGMMTYLGELSPQSATWLQYAMVCIGPDDVLRVMRHALEESIETLAVRVGAQLPADPVEAWERVCRYTERLAVMAPASPGERLEDPAVTVEWVYGENPALSADARFHAEAA
jgi:hypothetical protein